jgi:hypothetical protein
MYKCRDHPRLSGGAGSTPLGLPQQSQRLLLPLLRGDRATGWLRARSTVAEALKTLEWAGVLTWQHRITRIRERCTDLFGRVTWRWRTIRTSNAYMFHDPKPQLAGVPASKSENSAGTQDQDILDPVATHAGNLDSPLERALARFGAAVAAKNGCEQGAG